MRCVVLERRADWRRAAPGTRGASTRFGVLLAVGGLASCAVTDFDGAGSAVYRYVLGYDVSAGASLSGGTHDLTVPGDSKDDAIDGPNQPGRLHPGLRRPEAMVWDATIDHGQTDIELSPSSFWPRSTNGIAWRWAGAETLSPVEKYDQLFHPDTPTPVSQVEHVAAEDLDRSPRKRGPRHGHPTLVARGPATAWELQHHGTYDPAAHPAPWWSHLSGWASYVTTEPGGAPHRDIRVRLVEGRLLECSGDEPDCVHFRMADIEALMTELYSNDRATLAGRRCTIDVDKMKRDRYGRPRDPACRDLNPGSFHVAVTRLLGGGADHLAGASVSRPTFVVDNNLDWQVWSFPLVKFQIDEQEEIGVEEANQLVGASGSSYEFNGRAIRFVHVKLRYWVMAEQVTDRSELEKPGRARATNLQEIMLHYVLELDAGGYILGGEWIDEPAWLWLWPEEGVDSKRLHPDFLWMAADHRGWGEGLDDEGGFDDNPFIRYSKVKALLDCANAPWTCAQGVGNDRQLQ